MSEHVAIIGGGLSGLLAAYRLHQAGVRFSLFEARARYGGRILSVGEDEMPCADGFDLGPSWFWPDSQPALADLVRELDLTAFAQTTDGDMVFERSIREAPQRHPAMPQGQRSMRLAGGTSSLATALVLRLPVESLHLNSTVSAVSLDGRRVQLSIGSKRRSFDRVILAVPPRLVEKTIAFTPSMPETVIRRWRETATWMAPHAKFVAVYEHQFWRAQGLSGLAQSLVGPLVEIHDATTSTGRAALFGFLGIPASHRLSIGRETMVEAALAQLGRLFGPEAERPLATLYKDWASDPTTATEADARASAHLVPQVGQWVTSEWVGRLIFGGSEVSTTEPGYLAGAAEAASRAVRATLTSISSDAGIRN